MECKIKEQLIIIIINNLINHASDCSEPNLVGKISR